MQRMQSLSLQLQYNTAPQTLPSWDTDVAAAITAWPNDDIQFATSFSVRSRVPTVQQPLHFDNPFQQVMSPDSSGSRRSPQHLVREFYSAFCGYFCLLRAGVIETIWTRFGVSAFRVWFFVWVRGVRVENDAHCVYAWRPVGETLVQPLTNDRAKPSARCTNGRSSSVFF